MNTAQVAIGAIVLIVLAEHLAIWSLFWGRGWKVQVSAPKGAGNATKDAVAGGGPAQSTPPATVPIDKGRAA